MLSQYLSSFLTSQAALKRHYRALSRQMAFAGETQQEARAWQRKARRTLGQLLGLNRFEMCPPRPQKLGSERIENVVREEWRFQTERDVSMPFYLFIPDGIEGTTPLVVCPHGHGIGGKWGTAGRRDVPYLGPVIDKFNTDYGLKLARAGFVTACPDARGFGERREPAHQNDRENPDKILASSCHNLSLAGAPLGLTVQGMWTWDLMRLLDLLCQDPRIDENRIGCAGLSGGGLQTLNLTALDTRIRAAVVSGYFYGARESLQVLNSNCMCNMVPRLWENFDMGDIGALVAPRGLFIETGDQDPLNGKSNLSNVGSQIRISRKVFKILKAPHQLKQHIFHGGHRWDGSQSIPWLQHQLQVEDSNHGLKS